MVGTLSFFSPQFRRSSYSVATVYKKSHRLSPLRETLHPLLGGFQPLWLMGRAWKTGSLELDANDLEQMSVKQNNMLMAVGTWRKKRRQRINGRPLKTSLSPSKGDRSGRQRELYPSKLLRIANRRIEYRTNMYKAGRRIPHFFMKRSMG